MIRLRLMTLTLLLAGFSAGCSLQAVAPKEAVPPAEDISSVIAEASASANPSTISVAPASTVVSTSVPVSKPVLPAHINLKAHFYPQAPDADWSMPWQESCEEASVLLAANAYFHHNWTKDEFKGEILKLVEWEKQTFGSYQHTTVAQTEKILNTYLGLQTRIIEDPSYADVQRALSHGHLLVMTFAGKEIGNPYYSNGGPNYHAMLIKGYMEGGKVIAHDVGTKRGEDYVYSWTRVKAALHDYAEPIDGGAKRMIEILPPAK